jgi:hypothetical protein
MSQNLKGHLALISVGLLAATSPSEGATATQEGAPTISPAARWLQLAPPQRLALDTLKLGTGPKIEKLDIPAKLPNPSTETNKQPKSNLTPPSPNDKQIDQTTNVKLVAVHDVNFGDLKVTPEARAAYLSLPPSIRAQLSDPKGGAQVSTAALQKLAVHFRGFKPPSPGQMQQQAQQTCQNNGGVWSGQTCLYGGW